MNNLYENTKLFYIPIRASSEKRNSSDPNEEIEEIEENLRGTSIHSYLHPPVLIISCSSFLALLSQRHPPTTGRWWSRAPGDWRGWRTG